MEVTTGTCPSRPVTGICGLDVTQGVRRPAAPCWWPQDPSGRPRSRGRNTASQRRRCVGRPRSCGPGPRRPRPSTTKAAASGAPSSAPSANRGPGVTSRPARRRSPTWSSTAESRSFSPSHGEGRAPTADGRGPAWRRDSGGAHRSAGARGLPPDDDVSGTAGLAGVGAGGAAACAADARIRRCRLDDAVHRGTTSLARRSGGPAGPRRRRLLGPCPARDRRRCRPSHRWRRTARRCRRMRARRCRDRCPPSWWCPAGRPEARSRLLLPRRCPPRPAPGGEA